MGIIIYGFAAASLMPKVPIWGAKIAVSVAFSASHVACRTFSPPVSRVGLDLGRIIHESNLKFALTPRAGSLRLIAEGLFNICETAEHELEVLQGPASLNNHILRIFPLSEGCVVWASYQGKDVNLHLPRQNKNTELALAMLERDIVSVHIRFPNGNPVKPEDILFALEGEQVDPLIDISAKKVFFLIPGKGVSVRYNRKRAFRNKMGLLPHGQAAQETNERLSKLLSCEDSDETPNLFKDLRHLYFDPTKFSPETFSAQVGYSLTLLKKYFDKNMRNAERIKELDANFLFFLRSLISSEEKTESTLKILKDTIYYLLDKTYRDAPYAVKASRLILNETMDMLIEQAFKNDPFAIELLGVFGETALDLLLERINAIPFNKIYAEKLLSHLSKLFSLIPKLESQSRNMFSCQQMIVDGLFNFAAKANPRLLYRSDIISAFVNIWQALSAQQKGEGKIGDNRTAYKTTRIMDDFKNKLSKLKESFYRQENPYPEVILLLEKLSYFVNYDSHVNFNGIVIRPKIIPKG